jgi:hypothetical protein
MPVLSQTSPLQSSESGRQAVDWKFEYSWEDYLRTRNKKQAGGTVRTWVGVFR